MRLKAVFPFVAFLLVFAGGVFAQQAFYGSIVGNVTDPSEAVLPGADVTVTNILTGVTLELKTSPAGQYQALNLNPGTYRVRVTAQGFQAFQRDNLTLQAGQQLRADAQLTVGAVDQTVEVTDASPVINTENATTTIATITNHNTMTLPNQGAGVATFPDIYNQLLNGYADITNSAFSIGGTLSSQNAEVQDGMRIDGQANYVGGNRGLARPSMDSVEQVVVTTATPSAKYPQPAAIETVMKSGTNRFHGSAWYDNNNSLLNANNYFTHTRAPQLIHHGGGSIGGPIRKDRTFFIFSYQAFRQPATNIWNSTIPTQKMAGGDLSDFLTPGYSGFTNPIQLVDPLTGDPFTNNQIPADRISPIAKKFLSYYPTTPNYDAGKGIIGNYLNPYYVIRTENNWDARVDQYWTPNEHSYVRWTRFRSPNAANATYLPGFGGNYFIMSTNAVTAHHTSSLRPNLVNHIMFGLFRENDPLGPGLFKQGSSIPNYVSDLGIPGVPSTQQQGMPWFSFSQTNLSQPYTWFPDSFYERFIQVTDDVSWVKGRHNIQAGFDFRRNTQGSDKPGGAGQFNSSQCLFGCFAFNGRWSGLDFADMLLGYPTTTTLYTVLPPDFRNRNEYGLFLQDDFKATSRLSLTLGLRWDYFPVFTSEHGFLTAFDPSKAQFVVPTQQSIERIPEAVKGIIPFPVVTASQAGYPQGLISTTKKSILPRIGFAYRPINNTVVRGGFGMYRSPLVSTGRSLYAGGFYSVTSSYPDVQPVPGAPPLLTLADPWRTSGTASSAISYFAPETEITPDLHYSWNLAIERQIGATGFTAEYSAKKSVVPWQHNINAVRASLTPYTADRKPFPTLGTVTGLSNGAHYSYNALRLDARRQLTRGLFFDVTYVWAKTIDDLSGISGEVAGGPEDPFNRDRDRGLSAFMPPKRMTVNYVYQVPFGKQGSRLSFANSNPAARLANFIVQGWEIAGTYNFQSGGYLTPTANYLNAAGQNYDAPNTGRLSGRPNCTGASLDAPSGYFFNPAAFDAHVAPGTYGTCGKSLIHGNGTILVNQAIYRNFRIPWFFNREQGATLRLGAQAMNFLNHSDTPNPETNMASAFFGRLASDKSGQTRTALLQARIEF